MKYKYAFFIIITVLLILFFGCGTTNFSSYEGDPIGEDSVVKIAETEEGIYKVRFFNLDGALCHTEIYNAMNANLEYRFTKEFHIAVINVQRRETPTSYYYQFFNAQTGDLSKLYDDYDRYLIGRNFEKNLAVTLEQIAHDEDKANGKITVENIFPPYDKPQVYYLDIEQDYNNPSLSIHDGVTFLSFETSGIHIDYTTIDHEMSDADNCVLIPQLAILPYSS